MGLKKHKKTSISEQERFLEETWYSRQQCSSDDNCQLFQFCIISTSKQQGIFVYICTGLDVESTSQNQKSWPKTIFIAKCPSFHSNTNNPV